MTRPLEVVFTRRAERQVETIDDWWVANRRSARPLFKAELTNALAVLAATPTLGAPAKSPQIAGVRRILLPRTNYHLYYRVREEQLVIIAVWHAKRSPPRM